MCPGHSPRCPVRTRPIMRSFSREGPEEQHAYVRGGVSDRCEDGDGVRFARGILAAWPAGLTCGVLLCFSRQSSLARQLFADRWWTSGGHWETFEHVLGHLLQRTEEDISWQAAGRGGGGIDLHIEVGECFGVLGPNGAGKTTMIEILEGLLQPSSGEIEVLGMHWQDQADAIRQQIGISLQETQFSDKLSVRETLTLFRSFYSRGLDPVEAIKRVGLEEKSNAWIKRLSGGQRQRLAIAAALIGDPGLLFLDEPTTGLDPHSRRQLWEIIGEFRRQGRTTLLTTHYMEEAERLCDRVAIVDHGRMIASGSPRELIASIEGQHVVEFALVSPEGMSQSLAFWNDLPSVTSCRIESSAIHLSVTQPHRLLPALVERLERRQWQLSNLITRHASLDDVFVTLTGRQLQQDEEAES